MRARGPVIVVRGTRFRLGRGAQITVARGGRLILGGNLSLPSGPRAEPVVLGDHVWIGTGAMVLSGVRMGDGSVAAAVVTKDVPAQVAVAGNPARVISRNLSWRW